MFRLSPLLAFVVLTIGCRHRPSQPATPAAQFPSAAIDLNQTYSNDAAHIRFTYPAHWTTRPSDDFVFLASPGHPNDSSISLDVPALPFHFPGMIGVGLVQNGYLDDLKKQHADLKVEPVTSRPVAARPDSPQSGGAGRRVESTWTQAGRPVAEIALLFVHDDRVYILRVNGSADDLPDLRKIFDQSADSIEWMR